MSAIEVSLLKKNYGKLRAVDSISFNVEDGQIFSLLGANGAGKTTTIEILEGLRERDGGQVSVLGLDPWKAGSKLHRKIGVMPQGFKFFDYPTPREAVKYYAGLFGANVDPDSLLEKVLLDDSAKTSFKNLSGGQKQKVGLALALVNDPDLVFLDEPTTGLDPAARRAVWAVIRELKKDGRSVLLTTHYLEEAQVLADTLSIMNHGKIITAGTTEEILENEGSGEKLEVRAPESLADYLQRSTKLGVEYSNGIVSISLGKMHDAVVALDEIDRSGIEWRDLHTRQDNLEDIFVKLIGGRIEETGGVVAHQHESAEIGGRNS
ncbi:MAG TPA: ABC transporter ATP-binding protein [Candidatus Bathyarchaeia archaeon]|nr:ABC transporter ATP-binding protein [Candidatus Bathyarchaeia archaeon]